MSSRAREAEKRRLREAKQLVDAVERELVDAAERDRKASLGLWWRIEELDVSEDLKFVLHRLAQGERQ